MSLSSVAPTYEHVAQQQALQPQEGLSAPTAAADAAWEIIAIPEGMGLTFTGYKWRQNLSHVEVFVKLPATIVPKQVCGL